MVDAGEGDDTILLDESAATNGHDGPGDIGGGRALAYGGAGNDTWEVTVDEGTSLTDERFDERIVPDENGIYRLDAIEIGDFESGIDTLEIDATPMNDGFSLTSARIEQVDDAGTLVTELVLRYDSQTEASRDVVIDLRGATLVWDDVTFIGSSIPTLDPILSTS